MKLNTKAFAMALGLVWGLILLVMGWSAACGYQMHSVEVLGSTYIGMDGSFVGGVVGFAWGFVAGNITGGLLAYFYNRLVSKK